MEINTASTTSRASLKIPEAANEQAATQPTRTSPSAKFKIFLGRVPGGVTVMDIRQGCEQFGGVSRVDLPSSQRPEGGHKGFAFVTFATIEAASVAVEAEKLYLDGFDKEIFIQRPRQRTSRSVPTHSADHSAPKTSPIPGPRGPPGFNPNKARLSTCSQPELQTRERHPQYTGSEEPTRPSPGARSDGVMNWRRRSADTGGRAPQRFNNRNRRRPGAHNVNTPPLAPGSPNQGPSVERSPADRDQAPRHSGTHAQMNRLVEKNHKLEQRCADYIQKLREKNKHIADLEERVGTLETNQTKAAAGKTFNPNLNPFGTLAAIGTTSTSASPTSVDGANSDENGNGRDEKSKEVIQAQILKLTQQLADMASE